MALTPVRLVVTGTDGEGRSRVVWDGPMRPRPVAGCRTV